MGNFETGATCARVNDIVLTVINDGNGDKCGMTYAERCATTSIGALYEPCRCYAPTATPEQIAEAAQLIFDYYNEAAK